MARSIGSVRMVDVETVRRITLSLPESSDGSTATALRFYVRDKQFGWTYHERVHPKRPRQPRLDVLAVRAANEKEGLLSSELGNFSPPITTGDFLPSSFPLTPSVNRKFGPYSPGPAMPGSSSIATAARKRQLEPAFIHCHLWAFDR